MTLSPLQEQALSMLVTYVERRAVIDAANDAIHKAVLEVGDSVADFCGLHINDMDGKVLAAFCRLLDAIWGVPDSGLASYYLHECIGPLGHGGGILCCCEKTWKLRDIGELRAYVEHCQVCGQSADVEVAS
jgi:hypothetical protein